VGEDLEASTEEAKKEDRKTEQEGRLQETTDPGQRRDAALSSCFPPLTGIPCLMWMRQKNLLQITPLKPTGQVFRDRANYWKDW